MIRTITRVVNDNHNIYFLQFIKRIKSKILNSLDSATFSIPIMIQMKKNING